jgi:hypothetical protein
VSCECGEGGHVIRCAGESGGVGVRRKIVVFCAGEGGGVGVKKIIVVFCVGS